MAEMPGGARDSGSCSPVTPRRSMTRPLLILIAVLAAGSSARAVDSLPPLAGGAPPATLDALWAGFDPRREALNVELCKEWLLDGITCRVVRIEVGTFKGVVSRLALLYAFPTGAVGLPGLMQIH